MSAPQIRAVVFDFDGVLVRSIELHAFAYNAVLRRLGITAPVLEVKRMEGARSESIIAEFLERAGIQAPDETIQALATLKQRAFQRLGAPLPYPEAQGVVEAVAGRGFPVAVCTGTRRENVATIAPGILDHLDALVTQESYTRDKPHPEPYLTAAKALGVDPGACLVVENAPRGVTSAKAAGAYVAAVTTTLPAAELDEADVVVGDLRDILGVVPETPGEPARR